MSDASESPADNSYPESPTYFFDTSAIVKLFLNEPGSATAYQIFSTSKPIYTSWVLVAEALGVLKRAWLEKRISDGQYQGDVLMLFAHIREGGLQLIDVGEDYGSVGLATYELELIDAAKKHPDLKLDAADALQFAAIDRSFVSTFAGGSEIQVVTADKKLADAFERENRRVVRVNID